MTKWTPVKFFLKNAKTKLNKKGDDISTLFSYLRLMSKFFHSSCTEWKN